MHAPAGTNRSTISQKLNRIREFRNRVYHNEPICFNGNMIDFTYAENIKNKIYEILSWIDGDLNDYVEYFDAIDNKISIAKNI